MYFTMRFINITVKVITVVETCFTFLSIHVSTNKILNSYAVAFKMKLFTKTVSHTFESIHCMSMSFDFLSLNVILFNEI